MLQTTNVDNMNKCSTQTTKNINLKLHEEHKLETSQRINKTNMSIFKIYLLTRIECLIQLFQYGCLDDPLGHTVRITVRRWPSVLKVATFVFSNVARDSDASTPVSHTCREVVNTGRLTSTRQTSFVVSSFIGVICTNVFPVLQLHPLDSFCNYTVKIYKYIIELTYKTNTYKNTIIPLILT